MGTEVLEEGRIETKTELAVEGIKKVQWKFEESLIDAEHVVSVAVESSNGILKGEAFEILDIHDVFKLFINSRGTDKNTTYEDDIALGTDCPLLRPVDPVDYALFSSKIHPKPF